jgi:PAS domain S-box-containing protein
MFRTASERSVLSALGSRPVGFGLPSAERATTVEGFQSVFTLTFFVQLGIVFLAYFVAGKLGQATTSIRSSNLGPVWPAYGIALAAVLAYGYRIWPALLASAFIVALEGSVPPLAAAGQAAAAIVAVSTGAWLLRRLPEFDPSLPRLRDALGMIVLGAFASTLISASFGILSLYATGIQPYSGLPSAWLIYWLGDSTGALLVTPLVFTLPQLLRVRTRARIAELIALVVVTAAACFIVFGDFIPIHLHVFAFAVLPVVMWGAIDFGTGGATLSLFLIATIATVLTALGYGPLAGNTPFTNAVLLDLVFTLLAVPGLALASVIAERERAEVERERLIREQTEMEARLRQAAVVESSDDAIVSQDLNGVVLSWNRSASRIFGFTEAQAIGQPVTRFIPPELRDKEDTIIQKLQARERMVHVEAIRIIHSGQQIHLSSTISPLKDAAGNLMGAVRIVRDITERKLAEEALSRAKRKLVGVQEQERARIARELHDDIGQRLALLTVNLTGVSEELQTQASEIAADVQSLSHELHPSRIDVLGIVTSMKVFCREFAEQQQMEVQFDATGVSSHVPSSITLGLFRVLQEALHNSAKHSGVRECEVRLWEAQGCIHLAVADRGAGFDVPSARQSGGIGLITMQERVDIVDGELSIRSEPGRGTTIHAWVPMTAVKPSPAEA